MGNGQATRALVEMKERFGNLSLNVVVRANFGKRYFGTHACGDEPKRGKKAFEDFMILVGLFMVSDAIPFLGWLDTVKMFTAQMKRVAEEVDYMCLEAGWRSIARIGFLRTTMGLSKTSSMPCFLS